MRILNAAGRLGLRTGNDRYIDVESASGGQFSADVQSVYDRWDDFTAWAKDAPAGDAKPLQGVRLGSPAPRPRQIFAIGLNYKAHAEEGGMDLPTKPMVFTKFASAITGPAEEISLPPGSVDFEAEVVAVISRQAERVKAARAWAHVAGLTAGQDLSERELQLHPPAPQQFSLAKSFPGFAPMGPELVSVDALANPDDLEIQTVLNGEVMQKDRTAGMIFSIPTIIESLSGVLTLFPGDVIFTGTPSGVGWARKPQVFLKEGDVLETALEGVGTMRHTFRAQPV